MEYTAVSQQANESASATTRLYYLDWIRVMATLGVFLFHISNVFSGVNFEVKNAESSDLLFLIASFFYPWGLGLFFMVAGAGSWFALRRRTAGQFTRERTLRVLVPFVTGTLFLGPVQLYVSWRHKFETGAFEGNFADFLVHRLPRIGPKYFGSFGYHMWFLGFLFAFSLLALPIFMWLKGERGQQLIGRLAGVCKRRGGILIFILLIAVARLGLHPFFPQLQDWSDFFTYASFFVLGFLLFSDERFSQATRRDWSILLVVGIVSTVTATTIVILLETFDIEQAPRTFAELVVWAFLAAAGWCWSAFMLAVGMRHLDRDSKALRYGQMILLPFFVLHQPVILVVSYFVVQWQMSLWAKLLIVILASFTVTIALCELVIRRVGFLRRLFGMKAQRAVRVRVSTA
jgi:glucan biosynthesis protein C